MNEIKTLTDYQHVRLRTEMYLGSRDPVTTEFVLFNEQGIQIKELQWVPAVWNAFREIFDNACDEIISHGHGDKIEVTFDKDNFIFTVSDNGKGIPIVWYEDEKLYVPTLVMTKTKAGRNFGERTNVAGMNGIGAAAVNFCSEWFEISISDKEFKFYQKFHEGNELIDELMIEKPIVKKFKSKKSGTSVSFKLSKHVFPNMILPEELLFSHLYTIAAVNPHITFTYNGNKIKSTKNIGKNLFHESNFHIISKKDKKSTVNIVICPYLEEERQELYYTVVNNIPAFDGGTFINEFKKVFFGKITEIIGKKLKRKNISINRLDVQKNLIVFFDIKTKDPSFDSQSKTRFVSTTVNDLFNDVSDNEIKKFVSSCSDWIEYVEELILRKHEEKEDKKTEAKLKKSKKEKPAKLLDASSTDRKKCILFIAEGDSAISSLAAARNPKYHAGIPLRGKIVNVYECQKSKIVNNSDLVDLMNCIGLSFTEKANRNNLRYGKVYIAHDADEDGLHIGALLVNFFYKFWPELFVEEPYFFVWQTPLIIAEKKGKQPVFWYSDNYKEFDPEKYKGYTITRAKGLGSLMLDHWKYCIENPCLFPLVDDGNLNSTLELIFSPEKSLQRKSWDM